MMGHSARAVALLSVSTMAVMAGAASALAVDFKGKQIDMVIGNPPGGGTDGAGRLVAQFLEKYLPGNPTFVIRNMPGAQGVTALNHVFAQTKRDGLTVMSGSNSQVNPLVYRKAGKYDPSKFKHIGALGRGGTVLMIKSDAEKRLTDRSQPPIAYGVIDPTRPSAQMALWGVEYLGWNVKWVGGYRGANDTTLALERGEVDMILSGNVFLMNRMTETGRFKIGYQIGSLEGGKYVPRPELPKVPVFNDLIAGKIKDKAGQEAYAYWQSADAIDKWFALSDGTADDIVEVYRTAFQTMVKDKEFLERGQKLADDLEPMHWRDIEQLTNQMVKVTQDTDDFITNLLKKQGARVAN